jgi:hypothetical protein
MFFSEKNKKEKGATAILLTVLILGVTLLIAMGLSMIFVGEIKSSSLIGRSGPAFYAADAGAEYALYQVLRAIPSQPTGNMPNQPLPSVGAKYDVEWDSGVTPSYIKSLGRYKETRRLIEINW